MGEEKGDQQTEVSKVMKKEWERGGYTEVRPSQENTGVGQTTH